mmetsp:Transcript_14906/g.24032  ORF Transcript_14906/g.24032 Transcript_14906/m.24032 type:complete len:89 (+) Transcript_14906:178-444(+)
MGMRTSLAGSNFTSTGVANEAAEAFANSKLLFLIRAAFRDTLVSGFDSALHASAPPHVSDCGFSNSASCRAARAILLLSLILTKDVNA